MLGSAAWLAAQVAPAAPQATGPEAVAAWRASIPDQAYYPPGYRDLRIAAAVQVAAFPRDPDRVASNDMDGSPVGYDVIDCNAEYVDSAAMGPEAAEQSEIALEVERIRAELRGLGYRSEIYEEPLRAYERESLAALPAAVAERLATDAAMAEAARIDAELTDAAQAETAPAPPEAAPEPTEAERAAIEAVMAEAAAAVEAAAAAAESQPYVEPTEAEMAASYGPIGKLALEMERRRARLQPGKPRIFVEGGCGAGESEFVIRTVPANGKVWIANAFAFHVCMTKVRDPWDLRACRWTEVDPDNATMASGRYMYQARWPDGKTARGARVFEGEYDSDAPTRITIRKN
jgi:hypothetical protein